MDAIQAGLLVSASIREPSLREDCAIAVRNQGFQAMPDLEPEAVFTEALNDLQAGQGLSRIRLLVHPYWRARALIEFGLAKQKKNQSLTEEEHAILNMILTEHQQLLQMLHSVKSQKNHLRLFIFAMNTGAVIAGLLFCYYISQIFR